MTNKMYITWGILMMTQRYYTSSPFAVPESVLQNFKLDKTCDTHLNGTPRPIRYYKCFVFFITGLQIPPLTSAILTEHCPGFFTSNGFPRYETVWTNTCVLFDLVRSINLVTKGGVLWAYWSMSRGVVARRLISILIGFIRKSRFPGEMKRGLSQISERAIHYSSNHWSLRDGKEFRGNSVRLINLIWFN